MQKWIPGGAVIVITAGALLLNRRLGRRWGATGTEVVAALPGDDVVSAPIWTTTHAITIRATPAEVWPWLVQMGITRGGWYLSQRLDRIVWRIDNPSLDRIDPDLQHLAAGDIVPDSVDGTAHFRVISVDPERALVLHSRRHPTTGVWPDLSAGDPGLFLDFSWAFVLHPLDDGATRLLLRTRAVVMAGRRPAQPWMRVFLPLADFADFIYTRQMLRGIRRRVERAQGNIETTPGDQRGSMTNEERRRQDGADQQHMDDPARLAGGDRS
jgi:hypothetical protein